MEQKVKPVDVICICSADGQIRPLRVRMEDENKNELRVEIGEILGVEQNHRFGAESLTFLCRGRAEEKCHLMEIRYCVRTHSWSMVRSYQKH